MARILIIDDMASIRKLLKHSLSRQGYEVSCAVNGTTGMEIIDRESPDLVIADILMPEMDGLELILNLRDRRPPVKVIAISGGDLTGQDDFLQDAVQFGAIAALRKPFPMDELLRVIESALE